MSTNLVTRKVKSNRTLNNLLSRLYYGDEKDEDEALYEFFLSIDKAKQEMYDAQNFFDNVSNPELVDHAIYKMEAAKSKYTYLLKQAKEKGIKFNL